MFLLVEIFPNALFCFEKISDDRQITCRVVTVENTTFLDAQHGLPRL